jgi:hypothetical protein
MSQSMPAGGNGARDAEPDLEPTPAFVDKTVAQHAPQEAAELLRSDAGDLNAKTVTMDRSGAEAITADRVTMDRSGARTLDAKSAHLENSGAVFMDAENAVFYGGAAVFVKTNDAKIVRSSIIALRATENTTIEGEVKAVIYAGPADAKIKPLFTIPGAAAFGAGFAAMLLVFGRMLNRLGHRR